MISPNYLIPPFIQFRLLLIGFAGFFIAQAPLSLSAQDVVINEAMPSNSSTIHDEDGETPDWVELYNSGTEPVNLENYGLSDSKKTEKFWFFPSVELNPKEFLLVFLSGNDRKQLPVYWETLIDVGDEWKYITPTEEPPGEWRNSGFDDSGWLEGKSGFGYGDGDDSTLLEPTMSVFIRKTFTLDDATEIVDGLLHMDYDDGFVAYLNGVEIARAGLYTNGPPAYNAPAVSREAQMYGGGEPEVFPVDNIRELLNEGENALAIQVHNTSAVSSDLTAIPFFTIGRHSKTAAKESEYLDLPTKTFHAAFKLSADGETLYLIDPAGVFVDSVNAGKTTTNVSYGRQPDGGDQWKYFTEPTPDEPNVSEGFVGFAGEVAFSHQGGLYEEGFQLELSSDNPGDPVYYTTDGSDPLSSGELYSSPVAINKNAVVRARIIKDDHLPGPAAANTYLFDVDHKVAIVSISTDPDNLWDHNTGIYVLGPNAEAQTPHYGANFWMDWEIPVHIELYEPDGEQAFSLAAGVEIFGGWTRANSQKSLAVHFRNSYGEGSIKYQLFPDLDIDEFSHFVLRNSGNDWNQSMFRDALMTSLFHEEVDKQAYRPAVLYLNGEYWGIHNIREKVNEDFLASHFDLDPDEITILEANAQVVEGDEEHYLNLLAFIQDNDPAVDENYDYIKTQMDVFNFMQYQIGQIYVHNTDWPGNNIKFWRGKEGKWRWIAYDTDFGFGLWDYHQKVSANTINYALDANGPDWPNPPWSTFLLRNLMRNETFKNDFINAFADRLNTTLLTGNVWARINDMRSAIASEIPRHYSRWGQNQSVWQSNVKEMNDFAANRPGYVKSHIKTRFNLPGEYTLTLEVNDEAYGAVRLNMIVPENYPWSGSYFQGAPVTLKAIPTAGYSFVRWEGDHKSSADSIVVDFKSNAKVKAVFELTNDELAAIVINEINYNSPDDFDTEDWVELHNRSGIDVDISGWILKDDDDDHEFIFPENTVMKAGGFLVICRDKESFSKLHPSVTNYLGDMDFGLSSGGDCVRLFSDGMEQVDGVCFEGGGDWPDGANGKGATLALANPNFDNSDPANWYDLFDNGSPGEANAIISGIATEPDNQRLSCYPNPVSENAVIAYRVNKPGRILLEVVDMQGKTVSVLRDGLSVPGEHQHHWRPADVPAGMYIIRMIAPDGVSIAKAIRRF